MRLRAKLATLILGLLLVPILVMGLISIDYLAAGSVDDLSRSADLVINQIFDLMQLSLKQGSTPDFNTALKNSSALRKLLDSTQAFDRAVTNASIIAPDGTVIVAAQGLREGLPLAPLPAISELQSNGSLWRMSALIPRLLGGGVYAARRAVAVANRTVAIISVEVSTDLIEDQVRRFAAGIVLSALTIAAFAWLAVSLMANQILRQLTAIRRGFELLAAGSKAELPITGQDELGSLAVKFNELARQIRVNRSHFETDRNHLFDLVRSIGDAVALLDSEGIVLFANAPAKQRFGGGDVAVEGVALVTLLGAEHPLVGLANSTTATGVEAHDVPVELPDGSGVLISFFRVGQGHIPSGLLMVFRDMQPVLELENALDHSNRLARMGTLISGMAHQLRSPLHGMNMRLELLRHEGGDGVERHVNRLRQEVDRVDQAVEAILKFTRPADLKPIDFDVNGLVRELASRLRNERITIEFDLARGPLVARADRGMISEALSNIMTNAVEAMPQGGKLALTTERRGKVVEIKIADQGQGIPQSTLDRIFDLYYTTKSGGTGLGLPFALRAVELNGGKIALDSQLSRGTVCIIALVAAIIDDASTATKALRAP
jgi:signal transduction histidine kinase